MKERERERERERRKRKRRRKKKKKKTWEEEGGRGGQPTKQTNKQKR